MEAPATSLYLDLLKKVLINHGNINRFEYRPLCHVNMNWKNAVLFSFDRMLNNVNYSICKRTFVVEEKRVNGYDWPAQADTMIGLNRLNNIELCIRNIIEDRIPGDFIETGVWRGGATIFMRAVLKELGVTDRSVWVADSFAGLPAPNTKEHPYSNAVELHKQKILSASLHEVKNNFKKYGLLDNQVVFLEGWFDQTLPAAPIEKLSLVRLDGDLYESTRVALENLYPKLSVGGYIIIDDYHAFDFCKKAVEEYRAANAIKTPLIQIDKQAVYWRKEA